MQATLTIPQPSYVGSGGAERTSRGELLRAYVSEAREKLRQFRRKLVLKVHGSGTRVTATTPHELGDSPINPKWIEAGQPRARAFCFLESADKTIVSGEWDCTAGCFQWTYFDDEVIRILEGEALIEVDGAFRSFGPGATIFFPLGQTVRWKVPKYVRKAFFIRRPTKMVDIMRSFKVLGNWGMKSSERAP